MTNPTKLVTTVSRFLEIGGVACSHHGLLSRLVYGSGIRYVLTPDIDEYYKRQAELYLAIDDAVTSANIELA